MSNLDQLKTQYQTADKKLKDLEAQIEQTKSERSEAAKQIMAIQPGPFQYDGKEVVAVNMKGTYFLRVPFGGKRAAQPSVPSA
jgi:hypothetical protein